MSNLYLLLGIYILALMAIGFFTSRKKSSEDFLIGGRNRKGWQIMLSKFAGSIGASWFITYTAYAYEFGFGVYTILIGFVMGYLFFAYWAAPRIYKYSKEEKFYTQGDFVYHKTKSHFSKLLINFLSSVIHFFWLLVGVVGGAKIMSHFGFISYEAAIIATALVVLAYILLAGFKAVIITDILQSAVILVLLAFISVVLVKDLSLEIMLSAQTGELTTASSIGFWFYGLLSVYALSDRYQLCYAAKNVKSLRRGMFAAIVPILITATFLLMIGMYMYVQNTSLDSGLVFLEALRLHLPASLLPIAVVLFFAGLMSNADTSIFAVTAHYVFSKDTWNPVRDIRKATILLLIITVIIAYFARDIVDITVLGAGFTLTLSVPMIYLIAGRKNNSRFLGSTVGSLIGYVLGVGIIGIEPAAALPVIAGGMIGLLYNRKKKRGLA